MGGRPVRGFIFFRVWEPGQRALFWLVVLLTLGCTAYPFYLTFRERQSVQALSWSVASKVIVIDPGHGGYDPGCVGPNGVYEKNINLAVARLLAVDLTQAGAAVVLTRDGDYDLSDPGHRSSASDRKTDDLAERVALANKYGANLFISIHVNSIASPQWWGAQVFYPRRGGESKRLAALMQDEMIRKLGESYRWVKPEDFYVLRNVRVPAAMVEIGFLSNPREGKMMTDSVYQNKIAWCIYAGVVRFFVGEPEPKAPY
jgi:N-acetylmuramoyl-L-alanine amidase